MMLSAGRHRDPSEGRCLLELVSTLAGEPWSDHPRSVHPVLGSIARRVNDACSDAARDELVPLAPALIGTAAAPISLVLVEMCARAALSVRPGLRRLTWTWWPAPSYVADAVTVLAEHVECPDQRLIALLFECVDAANVCTP